MMLRSGKAVHHPTLLSMGASTVLIAVGAIRLLSYLRGGWLGWPGEVIRESWLGFLAYKPHSAVDVRYFKLLATPSVVALLYFLFRRLNRGHSSPWLDEEENRLRRVDFRSPWLRLALTTVVTVHWLVLEFFKFHSESFYPNSPLEDWRINLAVLLAGQCLAFWAMKHMSFESLLVEKQEGLQPGIR